MTFSFFNETFCFLPPGNLMLVPIVHCFFVQGSLPHSATIKVFFAVAGHD